MSLDEELLAFATGSVMLVMGTADANRQPAIARAVGVRHGGDEALRIIYSRKRWPSVAPNVAATGLLALTCVKPIDYTAYQLKGPASVGVLDDADRQCNADYVARAGDTLPVSTTDPGHAAIWMDSEDLGVIIQQVREVYIQTPGSRAGVRR
ncbi:MULTISPECIES: pyridoxamine 5'-phosphate oxidase family protein [Asticcacaulis]|uniref:pyridoxamine 5'-phosphate oxidase family protein n=1 Tax=Asticcacaulis TaxID=76890 RepID=UPI001AE22087|nr:MULTISPECIES: pyridoxamine 5'-phosphate oxidase family protein [Asticcacaulis]MBP2160452.1 hypothetical protein [Asticcacaulis solisilvae]MDR6801497.1 hypothetical protein [Asticcacaulis sp. BE141]